METTAYHSWGNLIYHLFETDLLRLIFDCQFQKVVLLVLQQFGDDFVITSGRSTPFNKSGCAIDFIDGVQCKCKCKSWFVFFAFLWTCQETDYFRISCEFVRWQTIAKFQALEIVYRTHVGAVEGVVGEGESVSWGGVQARTHQKYVLAQWFFDITEFFPDKTVVYDYKTCVSR